MHANTIEIIAALVFGAILGACAYHIWKAYMEVSDIQAFRNMMEGGQTKRVAKIAWLNGAFIAKKKQPKNPIKKPKPKTLNKASIP